MEHRPGSDEVLAKEPCPECGSKDNLVRYKDGHAYCFTPGCKHYEPADALKAQAPSGKRHDGKLLEPGPKSFATLTKRGLKDTTLRKYGYFTTEFSGKQVQVAPYYDQEGSLAAQKLRFSDKTFTALGAASLGKCKLFGQQVYGDRFDRKVVVHEGELDAMSTAQAMDFKIACVSINTGAEGAKRCLQANYAWLDRFEEILLWFDDDEPGRKAAQECAPLFEVGKVKIVRAPGYKDASAALQDKKPGDIEAAIYMATAWKPAGIVNASDGLQELLDGGIQIPSWPWAFKSFNEKTLGMRPGEVIYHVGGTGIAKTTLLFHTVRHLLTWDGKPFEVNHPQAEIPKIGWFGFEDNLRSVKLGLMGLHAGRRLHLNPLPNEELARIHQELFGNRRLELYDPAEAEYGLEATLGYIKFMAKALDCRIIIIDPLTELVASLPTRDRTQAEDQLAAGLQRMARSYGFCLNIGYHLRKPDGTPFEEGAEISIPDIKGSGALTHFSSGVLAYMRDQQGPRPDLLKVKALKGRYTGFTGEVGILKYDPLTGRYEETKDKWPTKNDNKRGGFGASPQQEASDFGQDF